MIFSHSLFQNKIKMQIKQTVCHLEGYMGKFLQTSYFIRIQLRI